MVKRTLNRGYIYPECDPPLVKDRSDIDYIRALAGEVNSDANGMDFTLQEFLEKPDAARISFTGVIATTGSGSGFQFTVPYDSITYDNSTGSTDLGSFALRPAERGWYMFTTMVRSVDGGEQNTQVRHLRNGLSEGRGFDSQSIPITATEENTSTVDLMLCSAGDLVISRVLVAGAAASITYECRLTMIQLRKLDV